MHAVAEYLASLHPQLPALLIATLVTAVLWLWRRLSISSWNVVTRCSPTIQQLPGLVMAAVLNVPVVWGKPVAQAIVAVLIGAFAGWLPAAGAHHVMKLLPIPYNGGVKPPPPDGPAQQ